MACIATTRAKVQLSRGAPQKFYVAQQPRNADGHVCAARNRFIPRELPGQCKAAYWAINAAAGTAIPQRPLWMLARGCAAYGNRYLVRLSGCHTLRGRLDAMWEVSG